MTLPLAGRMVEPSTCNYNSPIRLQASDDTDVPAYFRFAAFGKPYNSLCTFMVQKNSARRLSIRTFRIAALRQHLQDCPIGTHYLSTKIEYVRIHPMDYIVPVGIFCYKRIHKVTNAQDFFAKVMTALPDIRKRGEIDIDDLFRRGADAR